MCIRKAGTVTREDYVAWIENGKVRIEKLERIKSEAQAELDSMQTVSNTEEISGGELAEFSELESFENEAAQKSKQKDSSTFNNVR